MRRCRPGLSRRVGIELREVEDHHSAWPAILPQVGLVVLTATIVHLNSNRRFIGLQIITR